MRSLFLAAVAAILTFQAAAQNTNGSIEGTVTQSGSNTPIAEVRIALLSDQGTVFADGVTDKIGLLVYVQLAGDVPPVDTDGAFGNGKPGGYLFITQPYADKAHYIRFLRGERGSAAELLSAPRRT